MNLTTAEGLRKVWVNVSVLAPETVFVNQNMDTPEKAQQSWDVFAPRPVSPNQSLSVPSLEAAFMTPQDLVLAPLSLKEVQ